MIRALLHMVYIHRGPSKLDSGWIGLGLKQGVSLEVLTTVDGMNVATSKTNKHEYLYIYIYMYMYKYIYIYIYIFTYLCTILPYCPWHIAMH